MAALRVVDKAGRRVGQRLIPYAVRLVFFVFLLSFLSVLDVVEAQAQERIDGNVSYYSNKLHGRRMSSGKVYHRDSLTCAHRTLPFGTKLRVSNPSNGKEVIVEVADRGPALRSRVIDISYAAARELGIIAHGVKFVNIEILPKGNPADFPEAGRLFDILDTQYGIVGVSDEFLPEGKDGNDTPEQVKQNNKQTSPAAPSTREKAKSAPQPNKNNPKKVAPPTRRKVRK